LANPQVERGFIRIANELFDEILRRDFTKRQTSILFFILRMSYGCKRKVAIIHRLTDFELCGVDKSAISRELRFLEQAGVIGQNFLTHEYALNKDFDKWAVSKVKPNHIKNPSETWTEIIQENLTMAVDKTSTGLQYNTNYELIKNQPAVDKKTTICSLFHERHIKDNIREVDKISTGDLQADLINLINVKIPYTASSLEQKELIDLEERLTPEIACNEFDKCIEWYRDKLGQTPRMKQLITWLDKALAATQKEDDNFNPGDEVWQ